MRLTGGSDRGRKVRAPRGLATRPTSARVREALFNILGSPRDAAILDLYAGAGALALEALSRGARRAVLVENSGRAAATLTRNLEDLGFADRAQVMRVDVRTALDKLAAAGETFDWIFADPPYASGEADAVLAQLAGCQAVSPAAVIVIEHGKRQIPGEQAGELFLTDRRSYGDTQLSFYRAGRS